VKPDHRKAAACFVLVVALLAGAAWSVPGGAEAGTPEGNPSRGRVLFKQCQGCHSVRAGQHNSFGPNLHRVIGRQAGSLEDYPYSEALKNAGFAWTPERLDAYIADPQAYIPGVRMTLAPIADAQARADIIAYIIAASERE
jgi:cytochrome c2